MTITIKVDGHLKAKAALGKVHDAVDRGSKLALIDAMETIMMESEPEVPKDEGTLERSQFVNDPTDGRDGPEIEGGYASIYAARQHEELEWVHPKKGKAKYLEDPANRVAPEIPGMFRDRIDAEVERSLR